MDAHPHVEVSEARLRRQDKVWLDVERRTSAFKTPQGWLVAVVMRDITDRKAAQTRLDLFQAAMDNSMDALVIVDRETIRFLAVNKTALEWYGVTHEEYFAQEPHTTAWKGATRRDLEDVYDRLIAVSPQPRVTSETRQRSDGSVLPVEVVRVALEIQGRWVVVVSERDVTERMAVQRKLQMLNTAINEAADPIFVVDPQDLAYLDVNEAAARVAGVPREELMRLGPLRFTRAIGVDEDDAAMRASYRNLISQHPQAVTSTISVRKPNGELLVFEAMRRAVLIDDAWVIVVVHHDITARHAAMQRLERVLAAMNEAADGIQVVDPVTMTYEDVNEAAARLFGLSRQEMMDMGPLRVSPNSRAAASLTSS
ncbi:MAG: PAS domain S-box protein [Burkholderiales bacterium]|nr:MAG: PAS domain S-box protein [Burkholderiales bacterium]